MSLGDHTPVLLIVVEHEHGDRLAHAGAGRGGRGRPISRAN